MYFSCSHRNRNDACRHTASRKIHYSERIRVQFILKEKQHHQSLKLQSNSSQETLHRRTREHFHLTPPSVQHQTSRPEVQTYLKLCSQLLISSATGFFINRLKLTSRESGSLGFKSLRWASTEQEGTLAPFTSTSEMDNSNIRMSSDVLRNPIPPQSYFQDQIYIYISCTFKKKLQYEKRNLSRDGICCVSSQDRSTSRTADPAGISYRAGLVVTWKYKVNLDQHAHTLKL